MVDRYRCPWILSLAARPLDALPIDGLPVMSTDPTCLHNDFGGCQKAKHAKHSNCLPAVSQKGHCHHQRHGHHQAEECKTQSCSQWSRSGPSPFAPSTMPFLGSHDLMMRLRRGAGRNE
jgi:hypothetical protein